MLRRGGGERVFCSLAVALLLAAPAAGGEEEALRQLAGRDEEARSAARRLLVEQGEHALPLVLALAGREDPRSQADAALILRGMAEDGLLPGDPAAIAALAAIVERDDQGAKDAGEALVALGRNRPRDGVEPLVRLLSHPSREVRRLAKMALEGVRGRRGEMEPDAWLGWAKGEGIKYLDRDRPRFLSPVEPWDVDEAPDSFRTGREKVRLAGADLSRGGPGGRVPRSGTWLAVLTLTVETGVWPWGVFPARIWFRQGGAMVRARFLPTFDIPGPEEPFQARAVAPSTLDPLEPTEVAVQVVDSRGETVFVLASDRVRFFEAR